jgi:hypothetical protein
MESRRSRFLNCVLRLSHIEDDPVNPHKTTTTKRRSKKATPASATPGESPNESDSGHGDTLHELIAMEAYFCAERRGFAPGSELDDWLEAEARVNARRHQTRANDTGE